jgi:hypothetical protein
MLRTIILIFCFLPLLAVAQKKIDLKKKYFGTYGGDISSFQLDSGKDLINVDSTNIKVTISEKDVEITIGKQSMKGTYHVMFEGNKYFLLDCVIENQLAGERIVVYKKGKKISRDGLYPQPSAFLYLKK